VTRAELRRYLAEAVWYPTALRPGGGLSWRAVDDRTARATLTDRGDTDSATFTVDGDRVVRVEADRYRQETGDVVPWTGHFGDYVTVEGIHVPTVAAVEWALPSGPFRYWRARIDGVAVRFGGDGDDVARDTT
jgi:hypothetical protein